MELKHDDIVAVEYAVLGGLLTNPETVGSACTELTPDLFSQTGTKGVYKAIEALHLDGAPVEELDTVSKISEGVQLLKSTYLENLPISKFSDACHLNVNTFRKLFNKQYGMSPVKYRNKLRIERARELLQDGSFTVAEVAYASGFENVGYFCRYYRSIYNETPSQTQARGF